MEAQSPAALTFLPTVPVMFLMSGSGLKGRAQQYLKATLILLLWREINPYSSALVNKLKAESTSSN